MDWRNLKESVFINGNCMDYMKTMPDNYVELAIVDPPYGIDDWNKRGSNKKLYAGSNAQKLKKWDKKPPKKYWIELFRVSKEQIVWGGNHFIEYLKNTKATIIWDKNNIGMHFSNYELAWVSGIKEANRIFRKSTSQITETSIHPTQKPVQLYQWLLQNYAKQGDRILDTHVGSASSLIAFEKEGFDYVGFELDEDYFRDATKRLKQARTTTIDMFKPVKKIEKQEVLGLCQ